ncbi:CopD family protein [Halomonas sp. M20]|uniref:CopD family protein n=1 Tax=Halomonas sp. M20 TaxID=2763264 RepID=UPI001D0A55FF|nr:CopD family protein [Halomonas sp. M20]
MAIAIALHLLAAMVWVGGMFFAYVALRPVAGSLLERPMRLTLWSQVFRRFFPWVWVSIAVLLATGFWLIFVGFGGMANVGGHVHSMLALGIVMMLIFAHLYFAPFKRLKKAVSEQTWSEGGTQLNKIRMMIAINLALGLLVTVIGSAGRYL